MTALTVTVPRMTRVTWYKHRISVLGIPAAFGLAALLLWADGVAQRDWLSAHRLTGCLTTTPTLDGISRCEPYSMDWASFLNNGRTIAIMAAALALPMAVGLFAGIPWVAREFESGAFRYTWTQNMSSRRWLLGTFGPLALLAVVTAALYGLAAQWWHEVAQWRTGAVNSWTWNAFELTPLSMVGWTLLAMALALLLGVTIRRVLPAMIAFVAAIAGCVAATETWLQPHLFAIGAVTKPANFSYATLFPGQDLVLRNWFTGPNGQQVNPGDLQLQLGSSSTGRWLAQHHDTFWISYQPHSHLIWFELARNGIFVAVAGLAVLASVWWLRIRPAD
jgi:hypothetical protein